MKPWVARLLHRAVRWVGHRLGPADPPTAPALPAATPATPLPEAAYVTVVIPALNEARRIASVVAYALSDPATA